MERVWEGEKMGKFVKKKGKLDWNLVGELMKPIIRKREKFFKTGMILTVGINEKDELDGIRILSQSFDEDGEEEKNIIELKKQKLPAGRLSYIG